MSIAPCPTPTISAAAPVRVAASSAFSTSSPASTSPITASASSSTPSKRTWLARLASTRRRGSAVTPLASFGTANSVRPPSVFAETMLMSATWPWRTKSFLPSRRKPLPLRVAVVATRSGRCFAPSSIASATIASPPAIAGSQRPACVPPACASAATAPTLVARKGEGVRLRPISSSTMPATVCPRPSPPCSSGTSIPGRPISTNWCHSSREKPVSSAWSRSLRMCDTGACSATKGATLSLSIAWSSL